jgi:drug/metabolite transporter (DMT)-like permease
MKWASDVISPEQVVLLRILFGLIPVAIYVWWTGVLKWAHARHVGHFLIMAVVGVIAYYYGFAKSSSLLLSSVTGGLSGLTPIVSFVLAFLLLREENVTLLKGLGILLGFVGVLFIARPFGLDLAASNLEGVIYAGIGSLGVGASFVYVKRYLLPLKIPVPALITYQLSLSLIILSFIISWEGIGAVWRSPHVAAGLVLGLGLLGTGFAYIIYYFIIEKLGAVSASSVAFIPPVVSILIGAVLVGEIMSIWDYLGTSLIFAGLALVSKR